MGTGRFCQAKIYSIGIFDIIFDGCGCGAISNENPIRAIVVDGIIFYTRSTCGAKPDINSINVIFIGDIVIESGIGHPGLNT